MLQVIGRKFIDDQARELSFPFFSGYDRVRAVYSVEIDFSINLSFSNAVVKDGNSLILTSGSWEDFGFIVGADISGTYGANTIPGGTTITYIDGGLMMTDTALSGTDGDSFTSGSIVCDVDPDALEFYFNLIPNSVSGGQNSLIDNEVNRFQVFLDGLTTGGGTLPFEQLGNKSGGAGISAIVDRTGTTTYDIYIYFNSWGVKLPSEFLASACLKPYIKIIAYPQFNNPTVSIETVNTPSDANTGLWNEVGNGATPAYDLDSISWFGGSFFYNEESIFTAVINGNFDATSKFNVCIFFDSDIDSEYKNLPLSLNNNLMFNSSNSALGIGVSSGFVSGTRADGSNFTMDLDIDTTSTTATIIGTINGNTDFKDFIESLAEEDRKFKILIRVEDYTLADNLINPVWLLVYDGIVEKYVAPLGSWEDVEQSIYSHDETQVTDSDELIIEDDLKANSIIGLLRFNDFQSISTEICVRNGSTFAEFSLEKFTISLSPFPLLVDGSKPISFVQNRPFYLSPTNNNHYISVVRREDLDTETHYYIELNHSYLNDWKTWQPQTNADIAFFPNQNKNWFNYIDSPWAVNYKLTFETTVGNYENYTNLPINNYDSISAEFKFYTLDGDLLTKPLSNEICRVVCIHNTVDPVVAASWGQITCEPFENSPRYDISTAYPHDGVIQNPLIPLDGETGCKMTYATHFITTECLFDASKLSDPSNVSFTSRVSGRIEKNIIENRHKESFTTAKIPKNPTTEDRGGEGCCCSRTVIASQSSNDTYKNDITSNWQIGESVTFELKTCAGVATSWQPATQDFPNDTNAKYCTITWQDVLLADGCGTFKLYATYSVAGITGTVLLETFTLNEWVDGVESWDKLVNGTVRSKVVLNDANEYEGINFTNANVVDTIRFDGDFNDFQPNMAIRNLQHRDNSVRKVKRENLTRWELKVYPETICTIDRILNVHLLAENTIYISDYNQYAYDKTILDKAYIVSEQGGGAKIENFGGSSKKGLTCELELKVQKSKTHFGSVGSSADPNPALPAVPNTVSGSCESASYHLKDTAGTELSSGTIASGGTADITAPDGTVNIKKLADGTIHSQTVKSGSTVNYEVANNAITVNGGSGFNIKATDPLNIVLTDTTSASVTPDSVTYHAGTHHVDIVLPANVPTYNSAELTRTGQTTSYATGDDGDLEKGRGGSFFLLPSNSPFGNTNRFTSDNFSAQTTYTNNIVIDWSTYNGTTVLGYKRTIMSTANWATQVANCNSLSFGGYTSGWRLCNVQEYQNIANYSLSQTFNYAPFNLSTTSYQHTSTTDPGNTNSALKFYNPGGWCLGDNKLNTATAIACRTFTVTGTTLS